MTIKGIHSAASLAKLTAGRRAKIQKLADLEAERSKRSRLESLLSQKLVAKYGTRVKSETNRVIKRTVKNFLSGASHISEADLRSVEVKVKQVRVARGGGGWIPCRTVVFFSNNSSFPPLFFQAIEEASISRPSEPETSFIRRAEAEQETSRASPSSGAQVTPLILDPDDPKTNPWTVMDTLKAIEAEESLKADKIKLLADRKEMAKTLDEQMSIEGKLARRKKREDDAYLAQQQRMLNEWKREQQVSQFILSCYFLRVPFCELLSSLPFYCCQLHVTLGVSCFPISSPYLSLPPPPPSLSSPIRSCTKRTCR